MEVMGAEKKSNGGSEVKERSRTPQCGPVPSPATHFHLWTFILTCIWMLQWNFSWGVEGDTILGTILRTRPMHPGFGSGRSSLDPQGLSSPFLASLALPALWIQAPRGM